MLGFRRGLPSSPSTNSSLIPSYPRQAVFFPTEPIRASTSGLLTSLGRQWNDHGAGLRSSTPERCNTRADMTASELESACIRHASKPPLRDIKHIWASWLDDLRQSGVEKFGPISASRVSTGFWKPTESDPKNTQPQNSGYLLCTMQLLQTSNSVSRV